MTKQPDLAEWHAAGLEAGRCVAVAKKILQAHMPDQGASGETLLPAIVVTVALARVRDAALTLADEIQATQSPMLIERLAGVEGELYRLANTAGDALASMAERITKRATSK